MSLLLLSSMDNGTDKTDLDDVVIVVRSARWCGDLDGLGDEVIGGENCPFVKETWHCSIELLWQGSTEGTAGTYAGK